MRAASHSREGRIQTGVKEPGRKGDLLLFRNRSGYRPISGVEPPPEAEDHARRPRNSISAGLIEGVHADKVARQGNRPQDDGEIGSFVAFKGQKKISSAGEWMEGRPEEAVSKVAQALEKTERASALGGGWGSGIQCCGAIHCAKESRTTQFEQPWEREVRLGFRETAKEHKGPVWGMRKGPLGISVLVPPSKILKIR